MAGVKAVVAADIGGTNANLALVRCHDMTTLEAAEYATSNWSSFPSIIEDFLDAAQDCDVSAGCFAAAGPVQANYVELTNAELVLDADGIISETTLDKVLVINDFTALSYAVNTLEDDDVITLRRGNPRSEGVKTIIGAGTGLGQGIMYYDTAHEDYSPLPSEGGHADLPERQGDRILDDIREIVGRNHLEFEDVVSGDGLERIYEALTGHHRSAEAISESRHEDEASSTAFDHFTSFFARSARTLALTAYSTGGVYIAGGIAAENHDMFTSFPDYFDDHPTYKDFLTELPIHLITNYDISIRGAAYAATHRENLCIGG